MKGRLSAPDFIKGLAIMLMVYGHIASIGNAIEIHRKSIDLIYTFHMPLFLLTSGYFLNFMDDKLKEQITKQFRNVFVPYLIFITIYLLALIFVFKFVHITTSNTPPITVYDFFYTVFLHPLGGYWFLHSIFIISAIFLVNNFIFPIKKDSNLFLLSLWLSFFIASFFLKLVLIKTCFYFFMGFILSRFSLLKMKSHTLMLVVGVAVIFFIYISKGDIRNFTFYQILWCWGIFTVLWATASKMEKTLVINVFSWIGRNTLVILVLHTFFLLIFKFLKSPFLVIDNSGFLYYFAATICTVLLSMLSAKLFDYLKLSRFLFFKDSIYSKYKIEHG